MLLFSPFLLLNMLRCISIPKLLSSMIFWGSSRTRLLAFLFRDFASKFSLLHLERKQERPLLSKSYIAEHCDFKF